MKYLILNNGTKSSVIFPAHVNHDDMARALNGLLGNPHSAGECVVKDGVLAVSGQSPRLRLRPQANDAAILGHGLGLWLKP